MNSWRGRRRCRRFMRLQWQWGHVWLGWYSLRWSSKITWLSDSAPGQATHKKSSRIICQKIVAALSHATPLTATSARNNPWCTKVSCSRRSPISGRAGPTGAPPGFGSCHHSLRMERMEQWFVASDVPVSESGVNGRAQRSNARMLRGHSWDGGAD